MNDQAKYTVTLEFETDGANAEINNLRKLQEAVDGVARQGGIGEQSQIKLSKALHNTGVAAGDASSGIKQSEQSIVSLRYANYDLANTLLRTSAAITAVGAASLTAFASQERAFTDVERTLQTNVLPEQVAEIEEALKSLSTQIPLTFNQLSEIATIGNQMGIEADNIVDFTNTIARFSAITGISIESTTKAFGGFMAQTGLAPELLENLGSAIAKVGIDSNATEEQILSLMREITAGATGAGFAADQIVALSGTLASLQIAPERARGALTTYFETLNKAVADGGADLEKFAQIVGVTGDELEQMVRSGRGNEIFRGFLEGLQDLDNVDTTRALDELGLAQLRVTDTFRRLSSSLQLYDRDQQNANSAFQQATELQRQYAMILDTLASKFQILLNALMNFGAQVGEILAPAFENLIDLVTGGLKALTDFAQSPVGEALVRVTATVAGALAVWAALRGAIALATASAYAFTFVVRGLGGAGLIAGLTGTIKAFAGIKAGADGAAGSVLTLRSALLALGRAVVVGAILSYISEWIFNTGEAAESTGGAIINLGNVMSRVFNSIANALAEFSPALAAIMSIAGFTLSPQTNGVSKFLSDIGSGLQNWGKGLKSSKTDTDQFNASALDLDELLSGLQQGFDDASDGIGGFSDSANEAAKEIRTLLDYSADLSQVWSRAFDIRFSGQSTLDAVVSSFISIQKATDEAAKKIRDLNNDISSLNSDISIQEYFLSIAVEYGDTKRAAAIEADLAKKRADLQDKTDQLQDAQDAMNKTLVGNSKAASDNRKTITGLVQQYQSHIEALAASGANEVELAQATARLKQDFIDQATQLGFNSQELQTYAAAFDDVSYAISRVPRNITVAADVNPAVQAFNEYEAALNKARSNAAQGISLGGIGTDQLKRAAELQSLQTRQLQAFQNANYAFQAGDQTGGFYWIDQEENLKRQIAAFATGGFTGPGGRNEPAGIVHRGEYVFPQSMVNQSTGLPYADALGRLMTGIYGSPRAASSNTRGGSGVSTVSLSPGSIQAIAQAVQPYLIVDGQQLGEVTSRAYANDTNVGAY